MAERCSMFLAERYVPGGKVESATADASLARWASDELGALGVPVRYLSSTLIPADEICIAAFEAASADEVRRLIDHAGIPYERVVQSVRIG